ncbi:hypothetical protein GGR52DRAFT_189480 [Hypoxylon sp. FL1284]|nr:hypothetical protein GGR52DRAFT_189480 [Hypoxylon sp. FL1284]
MRVGKCTLASALLATGTATSCAVDDCLRAVQDATSSLREKDCESFVKVTVTPATSTVFSTTAVTTTGTTTRTTTQTITSAATEPSKRWLARHEVVDLLMGRAVNSGGPVTARATAIPSYASLCASSVAYESACSCLGMSPTTVTAPTPSTTQVIRVVETTTAAMIHTVTSFVNGSSLLGNFTGSRFGNSTGVHLNTTNSGVSSSLPVSSTLSSSSSSPKESSSTASTDKYRLKNPLTAGATSSSKVDSVLATTSSSSGTSSLAHTSSAAGFSNSTDFLSGSNATTSAGKFANSTSTSATLTSAASGTGFSSGTSGRSADVLNATKSTLFLNSTQVAIANATLSTTGFPDLTGSVLPANITSSPFLNSSTVAALLNLTQAAADNSSSSTAKLRPNSTVSALAMSITSAPFLNSTAAALLNSSTAVPFQNITHAPFLNATSTTAPFANATSSSVRFANPTTAPTPTSTCVATSAPFAVRVGQPGGLFDGWYLRLSGDQALFNPSLDSATRFSFDTSSSSSGSGSAQQSQSHLCSLDSGAAGAGGLASGNASAVVAVAENRTDAAGSAVYFVPPRLLDDIENDKHDWYAPLECSGGGGAGGGTNGTAGNATATLDCAQGGKEFWVGCGLGLDITSDGDGGAVVDGWNCTAVTLSIVYSP